MSKPKGTRKSGLAQASSHPIDLSATKMFNTRIRALTNALDDVHRGDVRFENRDVNEWVAEALILEIERLSRFQADAIESDIAELTASGR